MWSHRQRRLMMRCHPNLDLFLRSLLASQDSLSEEGASERSSDSTSAQGWHCEPRLKSACAVLHLCQATKQPHGRPDACKQPR